MNRGLTMMFVSHDLALCSTFCDRIAIMQEGVELRNELYHKANNPVEPKNSSLVRKYYAAFRNEMIEGYGKLFEKLSALHD